MNTQTESISLKEKFDRYSLLKRFIQVRRFTEILCKNLETEDYVIQSMPDVSPTKWHLAHTSWFFEAFVLKKASSNYNPINHKYNYLFNSYYIQIGDRYIRARRGLLSRPTVKEVFEFRKHIDENITELLEKCDDKIFKEFAPVIEIGINHEQQHQELLITDIKHVFSINPLHPVFNKKDLSVIESVPSLNWEKIEGRLFEIGNNGEEFTYDNELPKHKEYLNDFQLASRLVTNREYLNFMEDKGYETAWLWLSDGWAVVENEKWNAPLYWEKIEGEWYNYKLNGFQKVDLNEPVCHVSYYEADAYSRWAGARLPSEAEWETAANTLQIKGNFVEQEIFHPAALTTGIDQKINQMFGDVWEWTGSSYLPYPGYKTLPGALGEYNGKFMSGQMVLRGGSCATSITHIRKTYRNFFPPSARWQFMGIRLAKDLK